MGCPCRRLRQATQLAKRTNRGRGTASSGTVGTASPGGKNALKVLYDDTEVAAVRSAAEVAGLTPTGFVAAAGLALAGAGLPPALTVDRQLLAELLQTRTALSRYGSNLNQAVAALNSGAGAPVWLLQAVAGCARAADGVDALTATLARRLG